MKIRIVDTSALVAMLTDAGKTGDWAADQLRGFRLAAPHLLHAEVANVLRRSANAGQISQDAAAQAYGDLLELHLTLFPFEPFAERIWELRNVVSTYDAWYVALAENLGAKLVTLDQRLVRSHGPRCTFITPDSEESAART